jgi:GNAT superfamily N-acetyltransferase
MLIRARTADDIDALCHLVRVIHVSDGYPTLLQDDVQSFVVTPNCLAAWVCEHNREIVVHVSLHTVWSDEVASLAVATLGRTRENLASVSRLFVEEKYLRRGVVSRLLAIATSEAHERGLWPVLDVVTTYASAVALYEREGWTRLGAIALPMPNGQLIDEYVYAAPAPEATR